MKTKDKNLFLKPNFKNIPEELKRYKQWVLWKAEEQNGRAKKVPYSATTGRRASINKSDTWVHLDAAIASYVNGKGYDGIGFVLTKDDPFIAWDLDDCRNIETGIIIRRTHIIIKKLDSYTEISPSGSGVRIFVKAELPDGGRKMHKTEVYDSKRYLTLTGAHLQGMPKKIEERQRKNDWLYNRLFKSQEKSAKEKQSIQEQDAQDIIQKKLHKTFKSNNGKKFKQLYNGDISGYPSQSEADFALCSHLAFCFNEDQYPEPFS